MMCIKSPEVPEVWLRSYLHGHADVPPPVAVPQKDPKGSAKRIQSKRICPTAKSNPPTDRQKGGQQSTQIMGPNYALLSAGQNGS